VSNSYFVYNIEVTLTEYICGETNFQRVVSNITNGQGQK